MGIGRLNSKYLQYNWGWNGMCVFGAIGVPFHEFTHFITALLFLHKIEEVSLFRPVKGKIDGQLGYVKHSYRKTLYRTGGNVIIGAAPMILGSLTIFLVIKKFFPDTFINVVDLMNNGSGIKDILIQSLQGLSRFFSIEHFKSPFLYLCILVIIFIGCHMNMSTADLKGVIGGITALLAFSFVIPYYMSFHGFNIAKIAPIMITLLINYTYVLSVILVFDILMMLVFLIIGLIRGKIKLPH